MESTSSSRPINTERSRRSVVCVVPTITPPLAALSPKSANTASTMAGSTLPRRDMVREIDADLILVQMIHQLGDLVLLETEEEDGGPLGAAEAFGVRR